MKVRQLFELALLGELASVASDPLWAGMRIQLILIIRKFGGVGPRRYYVDSRT
jgi:hypothetical protein